MSHCMVLVTCKQDTEARSLASKIVHEKLAAGPHSITFDGSKLASGIYFYRLRAGDKSTTRKMVLVK